MFELERKVLIVGGIDFLVLLVKKVYKNMEIIILLFSFEFLFIVVMISLRE